MYPRTRISPNQQAGMKKCGKCKRVKRVALFHSNKTKPDNLADWCKACKNRYLDTGRNKANANLTRRFDLTVYEYEAMLEAQGGGCKICGMRPASKRLSVDHNHAIVKDYGAPGIRDSVRGLLCRQCNRILGRWKDDPAIAARAVEYLADTQYPLRGTERGSYDGVMPSSQARRR